MSYTRIAFFAADTPQAQEALGRLTKTYGQNDANDADVVVALGGDGFMLEALHMHMDKNLPIFGMHRGTIGFLMNKYEEEDLLDRLNQAEEAVFHPLRMTALTSDGVIRDALAINEVSMLRQTRQAAKIKIFIDERERMSELVCDGALVCTPAGSSAYNLSVDGPVLPVGANVLALTPISAFRPRRWRGAILPHTAVVRFVILNPAKRPVSAVADREEVRDVIEVTVREDRNIGMKMLFDLGHDMEERIVAEQFQP